MMTMSVANMTIVMSVPFVVSVVILVKIVAMHIGSAVEVTVRLVDRRPRNDFARIAERYRENITARGKLRKRRRTAEREDEAGKQGQVNSDQ